MSSIGQVGVSTTGINKAGQLAQFSNDDTIVKSTLLTFSGNDATFLGKITNNGAFNTTSTVYGFGFNNSTHLSFDANTVQMSYVGEFISTKIDATSILKLNSKNIATYSAGNLQIGSGGGWTSLSAYVDNIARMTIATGGKTTFFQNSAFGGLTTDGAITQAVSIQGNISFADNTYAEKGLIKIIDAGGGDGILTIGTRAGGTTIERMRWDNLGRTFINTTSGTNALNVGGNISSTSQFIVTNTAQARVQADASQVLFANDSGVPTIFTQNGLERFRLHTNGNLGIGSTSPIHKLSSVGAVGVYDGTGLSTDLGVEMFVDGGRGRLRLYKNGAGSFFQIFNNGNQTDIYNSANSDLRFLNGTQSIVNLLIKDNGNIGIGTSTSVTPLTVKGNSSSTDGIITVLPLSGGHQYSLGSRSFGSNFIIRDDSASTDRLVIDSSGSIGINTSSPHAKAQIVAPTNALAVGSANFTPTASTMAQINSQGNDSTTNILQLGSLNNGIRATFRSDGMVFFSNNLELGANPTLSWTSNELKLASSTNNVSVVSVRGTTSFSPRFEVWDAGNVNKIVNLTAGNSNINANLGLGRVPTSGAKLELYNANHTYELIESPTSFWAYHRLKSGTNIFDIALNDVNLSNSLQFRPLGGNAGRTVVGNGTVDIYDTTTGNSLVTRISSSVNSSFGTSVDVTGNVNITGKYQVNGVDLNVNPKVIPIGDYSSPLMNTLNAGLSTQAFSSSGGMIDSTTYCFSQSNTNDTATAEHIGFYDVNTKTITSIHTVTGMDRPVIARDTTLGKIAYYGDDLLLVEGQPFNGSSTVARINKLTKVITTFTIPIAQLPQANVTFSENILIDGNKAYLSLTFQGNALASGSWIVVWDLTNNTFTHLDYTAALTAVTNSTASSRIQYILQSSSSSMILQIADTTNTYLVRVLKSSVSVVNTITVGTGKYEPIVDNGFVHMIPNPSTSYTFNFVVNSYDQVSTALTTNTYFEPDWKNLQRLSGGNYGKFTRGKHPVTREDIWVNVNSNITGNSLGDQYILYINVQRKTFGFIDVSNSPFIASLVSATTDVLLFKGIDFISDEGMIALSHWRNVAVSSANTLWERNGEKIFMKEVTSV